MCPTFAVADEKPSPLRALAKKILKPQARAQAAKAASSLPVAGGKKAPVQVMVRMTKEEGEKLDRIAAGASRSTAFRLLLAEKEEN